MFKLLAPFVAVILVGIGIAVETPTNAMLTKSSSSALWASLVSFVIGTGVLAAGMAILRPQLTPGWMSATPWYGWIGGAYGAVVVMLSA